MANEEHLARLKQGMAAWNQWREANLAIQPDLAGADLHGAYLSRGYYFPVNLRAADLHGADLSEAYLSGAHLRAANLRAANLREANLSEARLHGADLTGVNLTGADLHEADLRAADLREANLTGADLHGAYLSGADLRAAGLIRADLHRADLAGADLTGATLTGATLTGATLTAATLTAADLRGADLTGAYLTGARLYGTDLTGAHLREAELSRAHFSRATLTGAHLSRASISLTMFADVDLSTALGLEAIQHSGPSTIGVNTLYRSQGKIPEAFLRGAGVPDEMITYMKSLVGRPFEFYSCFISYSSKDQEFAERLHADLQNKGVRCWFAPEDIQGGRKLHEQIDQAIRLHERLLLILSAHSMQSEWVKTEIAKARQREVQEKRQVLFPMRLVSFEAIRDWECFDADTGKDSAREIREYFIPDFSNWKNHDAYQVAFQRLLRDLKAAI